MAGHMFTYIKVVILLQFFSYLALVRGDGQMDFILERLQRLENRFSEDKVLRKARFSEDITLLETRFSEDIAILETRLTDDIELLRTELYQTFDKVQYKAKKSANVKCTASEIESANVESTTSELESTTVESTTSEIESTTVESTTSELENGNVECTNRELRLTDCSEWRRMGCTTSGIYTVFPNLDVYCDMETDGGGWTVFQRRMDGSENFYRNWADYTNGFGNLTGEFWLGNENIHRLTSPAPCELRIDMEDFENDIGVAKYGLFSVGTLSEGFVLKVENFTGNVTDSFLVRHNKDQFSTYDAGPSSHCSRTYKGGWWYDNCHYSNLNGLYHGGEHDSFADGINWNHWKGYYYSLKKTEMKFRPTLNG